MESGQKTLDFLNYLLPVMAEEDSRATSTGRVWY